MAPANHFRTTSLRISSIEKTREYVSTSRVACPRRTGVRWVTRRGEGSGPTKLSTLIFPSFLDQQIGFDFAFQGEVQNEGDLLQLVSQRKVAPSLHSE